MFWSVHFVILDRIACSECILYDIAYCYRRSSVVCRSVYLSLCLYICSDIREPCKNG